MSLHRRRVHPDYVEGCAGCKFGTVHLSPAAMATRIEADRDYRFQTNFAAEFHNGDREAYRRLRAQGLQPPRIAGSAQLERHAETRFEVETGAVSDNGKGLAQALSMCADAGIDPLRAATTPKETPWPG